MHTNNVINSIDTASHNCVAVNVDPITSLSAPTSISFTPLSDDELAREMQIVDDILRSAADEIFDDIVEKSKADVQIDKRQNNRLEVEEEEFGSEISSSLTISQSDDETSTNMKSTALNATELCFPSSATSSTSSLDSSSEMSYITFDSISTSAEILSSKNAKTRRSRSNGGRSLLMLEDRKLRKKEQNKNAATRYRQKKKLEMEHVANEEQKLLKRNQELQLQYGEYLREEKYLKKLIRELYSNM